MSWKALRGSDFRNRLSVFYGDVRISACYSGIGCTFDGWHSNNAETVPKRQCSGLVPSPPRFLQRPMASVALVTPGSGLYHASRRAYESPDGEQVESNIVDDKTMQEAEVTRK